MRLRYSVRQRRREQDQLAGSSLDSQKGGDKTHRDPETVPWSTPLRKVRVCGSTKSRALLGAPDGDLEDMDPSFRQESRPQKCNRELEMRISQPCDPLGDNTGQEKLKGRPWGNLAVPGMGAEEESVGSSWRGQKGRKWTHSWTG